MTTAEHLVYLIRKVRAGKDLGAKCICDEMLDNMNESCETTFEFWECECDDKFIHKHDEIECLHCNSIKDESPDARLYDVVQNLLSDSYLSKN